MESSVSDVWFRHSGEDPPDDEWYLNDTRKHTIDDIKEEVKGHTTTHMIVDGDLPDNIHLLAPELSHLKVENVKSLSNLSSISNLKNLETLNMLENNFSEGLPDVVTSMTSLGRLDISYCELSTLPESMSYLKNLKTLSMSGNNFNKGLPDVVTSMTSLRELDIEECELTSLPKSMSNLKNLETLDMSGNNFCEELPDVFASMTFLRELYMDSCKLSTLPKSMSSLKNLDTLDMRKNKFSEGLPVVITSMTCLRKLDISWCELPTLPESLMNLVNLKTLLMRENKLKEKLPDNIFSAMNSLEKLDIGDCHLSTLPPSFQNLESLKEGRLRSNKFNTNLSDNLFTQLKSLMKLDMGGCALKSLPKSMSRLKNLEELNIQENEFSAGLPDVVGSIQSVKALDIGNCQLTTLPATFSNLINLKTLFLWKNDFRKGLPEVVSSLTSLETLNINECRLTALPQRMLQIPSLKKLSLQNNNFEQGLPDVITALVSLEELDAKRCQLKAFLGSETALANLKTLDVSENNFREGLSNCFACMSNLQSLNFEQSKLVDLPDSMSNLTSLRILHMPRNDFSKGLPKAVLSTTGLEKLNIHSCELQDLPDGLKKLEILQDLDISHNNFTFLPEPVCNLKKLSKLDLRHNKKLVSLNSKILDLNDLKQLHLQECTALTNPHYIICEQGLSAIKQFYRDLTKGEGESLALVTIAVFGDAMAGKTSLIKTLQSEERKRVLTSHGPEAVVDETPSIFKVEELRVNNTVLRLIEMGGQPVYHMTYQLTFKQNCIPILVVNMQQYHELAQEKGDREAVRRLAFDWLAHLYVANSAIRPPKLVFTQRDKFDEENFTKLTSNFTNTANLLKDEITREEKQFNQNITKIDNFHHHKELFLHEDIYSIGKTYDFQVYEAMKSAIFKSAQNFVKVLPKLWDDVNEKVLGLQTAFSTFHEIFHTVQQVDGNITPDQLTTILTYMHDCGKVLWYKDIEQLELFIFHKIEEVTKLLTILFHHNEDVWRTRRKSFKPLLLTNGVFLEKEQFENCMNFFLSAGIMQLHLLEYLIRSETAFVDENAFQLAVTLLQRFTILYGPVELESMICFIAPSHSPKYLENTLPTDQDIILHASIMFKGLSIPQYIYQQMSVCVLKMFPGETSFSVVGKNGVKVSHDDISVCLVHDGFSRKADVTVSGAADKITGCWKYMVHITRQISKEIQTSWPGSRMVHKSSCAHCILKGESSPELQVTPRWCLDFQTDKPYQQFQKRMVQILCGGDKILSPFVHPCTPLTSQDTQKLKNAVAELRKKRQEKSSKSGMLQEAVKSQAITMSVEDEPSDLSDDDEYILPPRSSVDKLKYLKQVPVPTTKQNIKHLFSNTEKVFSMTKPRGSALIINNKKIINLPDRPGSEVDVQNLNDMLQSFQFNIETKTDLTAREIYDTVRAVINNSRNADHGMFFLFIGSHGVENHVYGSDGKLVKLTDLYDLLSGPHNPVIADKPKLVLIQACNTHPPMPKKTEHADVDTATISVSAAITRDRSSLERRHGENLFVIKASFRSYAAWRFFDCGSPFVRCFVRTIYRHACHRDMHEIYKAVQYRVRKFCKEKRLSHGLLPVAIDTLTHCRKLYLFPGYDGGSGREKELSLLQLSNTFQHPPFKQLPSSPTARSMLSESASTSQQVGRGKGSESITQKKKLYSSEESKEIVKHKRVE